MYRMQNTTSKKSVVVIGGGTGIYPVLQGLKKYHETVSIKAVISVADSGGSNARIRDEFGILPVSDINRALAALSTDVEDHDQLLRELFLYRFHNGTGLIGHNFGNLLLIALTDMLGSEEAAIKAASKILRIHGRVLPVTTDDIHIVATFDDGVVVEGEHQIDEPEDDRIGRRIVNFYASPRGKVTAEADAAIREADLVLLGPGDLYSSLLANCVVDGVSEAIRASKGIFVYASNLMTRPGQTDGLTATEHVREVVRYVGQMPDVVVINTGKVPEHLLKRYAEAAQFPVVDDCDSLECKVIRADLLSSDEVVRKKGDVLLRSLVRGDGDKFATMLLQLLK
jgi:uncharacterized cofD-like protein